MRRAGVLTELQIALALTDPAVDNLTAGHDGTTKRGVKLSGADIAVGSVSAGDQKVFSLGIEEVADGTAVTALDSFMRRLETLLSSLRPAVLSDDMRKVLLKIQAGLSDRCPVELKWTRLLQEKKFDLIQQHYQSLPLDQQVDLARVYEFFAWRTLCLA
jgi:hypothetical protein